MKNMLVLMALAFFAVPAFSAPSQARTSHEVGATTTQSPPLPIEVSRPSYTITIPEMVSPLYAGELVQRTYHLEQLVIMMNGRSNTPEKAQFSVNRSLNQDLASFSSRLRRDTYRHTFGQREAAARAVADALFAIPDIQELQISQYDVAVTYSSGRRSWKQWVFLEQKVIQAMQSALQAIPLRKQLNQDHLEVNLAEPLVEQSGSSERKYFVKAKLIDTASPLLWPSSLNEVHMRNLGPRGRMMVRRLADIEGVKMIVVFPDCVYVCIGDAFIWDDLHRRIVAAIRSY
jgi:hypothetical protein